MGYNISDIGGNTGGGPDVWTATLDLSDPSASTVSGDFNVLLTFGGGFIDVGEADSYSFSAVSNPAYGSVVGDPVDGTYTFTVDRDAVIASGSDQVISFTVTGTSGGDTDSDTVVITILICVARGTLIRTPDGLVPVENLQIGDLVATLDRDPQPVRWIGSRKISAQDLAQDPDNYPIRLRAGALGPGSPSRDLLVTQNHRIFLQDWRAELLFGESQVLVPAKSLLNDSTICRDYSVDEIEYFHVLFDDHNVIFTEDAPTESLHPGLYLMSSMTQASQRELLRLLPDVDRPDGYGTTARHGLKPWEGELLFPVTDEVDT